MDPTCHPLLFFSFFSSAPYLLPRALPPPLHELASAPPRPAPPRTHRRCSALHAPALPRSALHAPALLRPPRAGSPPCMRRLSALHAPATSSVRPRAPLHPSRAGAPPAPARRSALPCAPLRPELDELGRRRSSLLRAELRRRCSSLLRWELDELGRRRPSFLGAEPVLAPPSPSRSRTEDDAVQVGRGGPLDLGGPLRPGSERDIPSWDEPNPPRLQTKQL